MNKLILNRTAILIIPVLLLMTFSLSSEEIELKNGRSVYGNIVGQSRDSVTIQDLNGKRQVIKKSSIRKIDYNATDPAVLRAREKKKAEELAKKQRAEEEARRVQAEKERQERERLAREEDERRRAAEEEEARKKEEDQKAEEAERKRQEELAAVPTTPEEPPLPILNHLDLGYRYGYAAGETALEGIYTGYFTLRNLANSTGNSEQIVPGSLESSAGSFSSIHIGYQYDAFFTELDFSTYRFDRSMDISGTSSWTAADGSTGTGTTSYTRGSDPYFEVTRSEWKFGYDPFVSKYFSAGLFFGVESYTAEWNPTTQGVDSSVDSSSGVASTALVLGVDESAGLEYQESELGFRLLFQLPEILDVRLSFASLSGTGTFHGGESLLYLGSGYYHYSQIGMSGKYDVEGYAVGLDTDIPITNGIYLNIGFSSIESQATVSSFDLMQIYNLNSSGTSSDMTADDYISLWFLTNNVMKDSFAGTETNTELHMGVLYRLDFADQGEGGETL